VSPPRVSVLLTTHNGAATIGASIASIRAQTLADFELVIVDDASTDATPGLLAALADEDSRLRILHPGRNLGIVGARNFGFAACRAPLVAALDHDDLSDPERLARQVAYLDANPGVVLVGTGVRILHPDGHIQATDHAPGSGMPAVMRWGLLTDNPLTWASVMLRAEAVQRLGAFLRPEFEYADDFDLYLRLARLGGIARLDAVLTTYRWHQGNTTHRRAGALHANARNALAAAIADRFGAAAPDLAALIVRHLHERVPVRDAATLDALGSTLARLLQDFDDPAVHAAAARDWWRLSRAALRSGHPWLVTRFRAQPALRQGFAPPPGDLAVSLAIGALRALSRP
jgi:glycosyltransferase involved in cell wall biosynthesis